MVLAMSKCHIVYIFESNLHPYIFPFRLVQTHPLYKAAAGCILVPDALNFSFINHFRTGNRDQSCRPDLLPATPGHLSRLNFENFAWPDQANKYIPPGPGQARPRFLAWL